MSRLDDLYRKRAAIAAEIYRLEAAQAVTPFRSGAILADAAELYGVGIEEVLSECRDDRVVKARQAACWLLRGFGMSFPRIGSIVGRDHTTVMYAVRKIDNDPAVRALLWPILTREVAA